MYYKIKDNVDLSVLEKYGYERVGSIKSYAKETDDIGVCILFNRVIAYYYLPYKTFVCFLKKSNKQHIKDLINAGLVEEVDK